MKGLLKRARGAEALHRRLLSLGPKAPRKGRAAVFGPFSALSRLLRGHLEPSERHFQDFDVLRAMSEEELPVDDSVGIELKPCAGEANFCYLILFNLNKRLSLSQPTYDLSDHYYEDVSHNNIYI